MNVSIFVIVIGSFFILCSECFIMPASHPIQQHLSVHWWFILCANHVDFGNYISAIYPSELELKDTPTSSTEVCYLNTNIKTGDNTPFRISIYDKREDFAFQIVNFPHTATFPPIHLTVFIYLNWWDMLEFARPKLTSSIDSVVFHYDSDSKALKPIYFKNHLINSSVAIVLSSRSMVQPCGRWD